MSEEREVKFIKGNDTHQEEFIDLINYVFHMNGKDNDFYTLLPKLYKKEYHPCENNYLVLENNRIMAAVGSFPGEVTVCGTNLKFYGIGNVAVNPYSRSKGYMKKLMVQAVDDMLKEDVDFSVLGGRRNRYSYFSYEIVGRKYSFWIDESNIKHSFVKDRKEKFHFKIVNEDNKEAIQAINELQSTQPLQYKRDFTKLYDILKSWKPVDIYSIYEGNKFTGYLLLYDKGTVKEILLHNQEDITEVLADFINSIKKEGINVEIPEYQRLFLNSITAIAENVTTQSIDNLSVFHYGKVIEAFLRLKAQSDLLMDGKINFLIHGKKMVEKLHIEVKDNQITVTNCDTEVDFEYTHLEAMSMLFQNYSPQRNNLPLEVQTWLPLPFHIFPADMV